MPRDDYDDEDAPPSRPAKKKKKAPPSQDNSLKILLIVLGSIAGIGILACCGSVAAVYLWFQKNIGQIALTKPADIQKLTAEMTDITIPPEFVPKHGSSVPMLKLKTATYQWCPTGDCPEADMYLNSLTISSIDWEDDAKIDGGLDSEGDYTDEMLKHSWKEYAKTEHELDIRGRKCKFLIIQGDQYDYAIDEDDEPATTPAAEEQPATTDDAASEKPATDAAETPSSGIKRSTRKAVQIHGKFPGKSAECSMEIRLTQDNYNEQIILDMLKSIR